jgi:hypothetical protein
MPKIILAPIALPIKKKLGTNKNFQNEMAEFLIF